MTTHRLMPPSNGQNTTVVNGRTYVCTLGSTIDVPDFDADILESNGWTRTTSGGIGTTAQRPILNQAGGTAPKELNYYDTTLGYVIVYDGKTWRNPSTGAAV